jgi:hypothetical protein
MDGLLSFLLLAGFFYLMMRFGCGAHMIHRHGRKHADESEKKETIAPVCQRVLPDHQGYGKMHKGVLYRFLLAAMPRPFRGRSRALR